MLASKWHRSLVPRKTLMKLSNVMTTCEVHGNTKLVPEFGISLCRWLDWSLVRSFKGDDLKEFIAPHANSIIVRKRESTNYVDSGRRNPRGPFILFGYLFILWFVHFWQSYDFCVGERTMQIYCKARFYKFLVMLDEFLVT